MGVRVLGGICMGVWGACVGLRGVLYMGVWGGDSVSCRDVWYL